jgi:hypothetical protein
MVARKAARIRTAASESVFLECATGDKHAVESRMSILNEVRLLPLNDEILAISRRLLHPGPFPANAALDAIHIAAATVFGCEYLLTWNFKYINNAQIKRRATRIIEEYGYEPTTICTPDELMGPRD